MRGIHSTTSRARRGIGMALSAGLAVAVFSACSNSSAGGSEEGQTLTVAYHMSPENPVSVGIQKGLDYIEQESDGRVTFEVYPNGQLGKAEDAFRLINTNQADLALTTLAYHTEELPLNQAWLLPLGLEAEKVEYAYWRAINEDTPFVEEYRSQGVEPLSVATAPNYEISSKSTPVANVEDLQGLRVRAPGDLGAAVVQAMDASPVEVATPEIFTALERGTADATYSYLSSWKALGLHEVLHHTTDGLNISGTTGVTLAISSELWDTFDDDLKKVFQEGGRITSDYATNAMIDQAKSDLDEFVAAGDLTTYTWSKEEVAKLQPGLDQVIDDWKKLADGAGLNPDEAISTITSLSNEYEAGELPAYG